MSRRIALFSLVLALVSVPGVAAEPDAGDRLLGDWAGWAYLGESGDLPLRLRIDRGPDGLRVRFDELVSRSYDVPAAIEWDAPRVVVTRTRPTGSRIVLDGEVTGAEIRGSIDWAGHRGEFELALSSEAIARIPPPRRPGPTVSLQSAP